MKPATIERFLGKIDQTEHCWLWTGATAGRGYGVFWVGDRMDYAHRVSHELFVGPIPDGLEIDHLCRTLLCVRPTHLEAVTHAENVERAEMTVCKRGHPFDQVNTYIKPNGARECRLCSRERQRNRKKAAQR